MIRLAIIGAVVVVAGCADVPALPHGTCGNFVLERGEDCDEPPDSADTPACIACSFACEPPGAEGCGAGAQLAGYDLCCPVGYACGGGGGGFTCAKPTGGLVLESEHHFAASEIAIGDVTGDHTGDTIGLTEDRVLVRTTGPDGLVDRETPFGALHSAFAVGPFDPGFTTDVVAGTLGGVAGFVGGADGLAAYPFSSFGERNDGTPTRIAMLTSLTVPYVQPVVIDEVADATCPAGCAMLFLETVGPGAGPPPAPAPVCGSTAHHLLDIVGDRIPTTTAGAAGQQWLALGLHHEGVADQLCRYRELAGSLSAPDPIALPGMAQLSPDGELVFADLDGTNCPSLLVPLAISAGPLGTTPAIGLVQGGRTAGVCTFAATVAIVVDSENAVPLAAGDLDGDGVDEVITSEGIAKLDIVPVPTLDTDAGADSPRRWRGAAIVDFNHDGRLDVVGHARDRDNIDLMRQVSDPTEPLLFTTTLIDTLGVVRRIHPGDFDGDLFGDVMFVEVGTPDERRLAVAFGQPAGGAPAIEQMARLGEVFDIDERDYFDANGYDSITDAVVVHTAGATLFYGRGTRQLIAPLVTQDAFGPIEPIEVGIGDFDGDAGADLIAIGRDDSGLVSRFVATGDATGGFVFPMGPPGSELVDLGAFDEGVGVFATARLGTSDRDVLVGFSAGLGGLLGAVVIDGIEEAIITTIMEGDEILSVIAADVDGAAGDELIVSVRRAGVPIAYRVQVVKPPGVPSVVDATSLTDLAQAAGYTCGVAAPIELDGDPTTELVLACADGLRTELIEITPDGVAVPLADVPEPAIRLIVGDLTGDGVDDLLATSASGILYQFRQCSSRTVADCDPEEGTRP